MFREIDILGKKFYSVKINGLGRRWAQVACAHVIAERYFCKETIKEARWCQFIKIKRESIWVFEAQVKKKERILYVSGLVWRGLGSGCFYLQFFPRKKLQFIENIQGKKQEIIITTTKIKKENPTRIIIPFISLFGYYSNGS